MRVLLHSDPLPCSGNVPACEANGMDVLMFSCSAIACMHRRWNRMLPESVVQYCLYSNLAGLWALHLGAALEMEFNQHTCSSSDIQHHSLGNFTGYIHLCCMYCVQFRPSEPLWRGRRPSVGGQGTVAPKCCYWSRRSTNTPFNTVLAIAY